VYLNFPPTKPALSQSDGQGHVRITDPDGGIHLLEDRPGDVLYETRDRETGLWSYSFDPPGEV
jgi:hypothetical protein